MVAGEGGQLVGVGVLVGEKVVVFKERVQLSGGVAARDIIFNLARKAKVKHTRHVAIGGVIAEKLFITGIGFAKDEEVHFAYGLGLGKDGRAKGAPEFGIDMLDGVHAETVDIKVG